MHLTTKSGKNTQIFHKIFIGAIESGGPMGGFNFAKILLIRVPNVREGNSTTLNKKHSIFSEFCYVESGIYLASWINFKP